MPDRRLATSRPHEFQRRKVVCKPSAILQKYTFKNKLPLDSPKSTFLSL